jgi:hypothetical protein
MLRPRILAQTTAALALAAVSAMLSLPTSTLAVGPHSRTTTQAAIGTFIFGGQLSGTVQVAERVGVLHVGGARGSSSPGCQVNVAKGQIFFVFASGMLALNRRATTLGDNTVHPFIVVSLNVGSPKLGLSEHTGGFGKKVPITQGAGINGSSALVSTDVGQKLYNWAWDNYPNTPAAALKTITMGSISTNATGTAGSVNTTIPASAVPATSATGPITVRGSWSSCSPSST